MFHAAFENLSSILNNYCNRNQKDKYYSLIETSVYQAEVHNPWFIERFVKVILSHIAEMTKKESIEKLIDDFKPSQKPKKVLVIAAGNIPMVSFHDVMCVLLSGHYLVFKPSSKDKVLMKTIFNILSDIDVTIKERVFIQDDVISSNEIDAVIATGTNYTAAYIHQYFSKYPRIVRNNRTSLAIINNTTTDDELKKLADDILLYFGMGCRNVSKLFVPEDFDIQRIFKSVLDYGFFMQHHKYMNNYEYYRSIYLLNRESFLENNFLILKETTALHAPVANLFYERYKHIEDVHQFIQQHKDEIQCVVGKNFVPFGKAQFPDILEFADGINTKEFLMSL
ncbi:MAG: acyl-CoA reductase [Bacteroidota bacterium]